MTRMCWFGERKVCGGAAEWSDDAGFWVGRCPKCGASSLAASSERASLEAEKARQS